MGKLKELLEKESEQLEMAQWVLQEKKREDDIRELLDLNHDYQHRRDIEEIISPT